MNSSETSSKLSDMNSSETSSKTHSPFKNASPRFRWHGAHLRVCRLRDTLDTWARPRGEHRQAKPAGFKHSAIQPVTQPRTQRDSEIPDCIYPFAHMHYVTFPHMHYVTSPHMHYVTSPTAFTHFPHALCDIPPHALCDIPDCIYPFPHMHYCVMRHSPTLFLHYICRLCEGTRCNTWRNTARSSILIHILYIFADLRGTRRDTCAAPYTLHYICRPAKGLV